MTKLLVQNYTVRGVCIFTESQRSKKVKVIIAALRSGFLVGTVPRTVFSLSDPTSSDSSIQCHQ